MKLFQFSSPQQYVPIFHQMRDYTLQRNDSSADAIWLLEHYPVFTQGQAGKSEHIIDPGNIPVVQSDRGGQVTYHGPGQLMIYTLFDLKRYGGLKSFVQQLQNTIILLLKQYHITSHTLCNAPGVYVDNQKICSLGLRVRQGCAYHGISLNVKMDLSPFSRINPCGMQALKMTQISHFMPTISLQTVIQDVVPLLTQHLTPSLGSHYDSL